MYTLQAFFSALFISILIIGAAIGLLVLIIKAKENANKGFLGFCLFIFLASFFPIIPSEFKAIPERAEVYRKEAQAKEYQELARSETSEIQSKCQKDKYFCSEIAAGQTIDFTIPPHTVLLLSKADCAYMSIVFNSQSLNACEYNKREFGDDKYKGTHRISVTLYQKQHNSKSYVALSPPQDISSRFVGVLSNMFGTVGSGVSSVLGIITWVLAILFFLFCLLYFIYKKFIEGAGSGDFTLSGDYSSSSYSAPNPKPKRRWRRPKDEVTSKGVLVNFKSGRSVFRRFKNKP